MRDTDGLLVLCAFTLYLCWHYCYIGFMHEAPSWAGLRIHIIGSLSARRERGLILRTVKVLYRVKEIMIELSRWQ